MSLCTDVYVCVSSVYVCVCVRVSDACVRMCVMCMFVCMKIMHVSDAYVCDTYVSDAFVVVHYVCVCSAVLEAHKTFHRYTVRAKRGTAQSIRDGQQGGHQPK